MTCKDCLHYDMCRDKFRNAKASGYYELTDEEEYFSHSDDCDFYISEKSLIHRGYSVIPEGAIVLTKEEMAAIDAYQKKHFGGRK